jgi:hypothetical protein
MIILPSGILRKQKKYKQVLAAALLLLYTFIATPVQLWHQHNGAQQSKIPDAKISKQGGSNMQAGECKICQHTYTSYLSEEVSFTFGAIIFSFVKNPTLKTGNSIVCLNRFSNKGPPLA